MGGELRTHSDCCLEAEWTWYPGTDRPHSIRRYGDNASVFYYGRDELGSVTGAISTGGGVVNRYRYTPWGEYEPGTTETVYNPQRFAGSIYDAYPRLYFMRARYYDPELARFISEDPIGIDGGMNLYAYAGNNPVNFRDPYGLEPCTPVFENEQLVGFSGDCYQVKVNVRKGGGGGTVYVGGSGRGGSWYRPGRGGGGITLAQLLKGAKSGAASLPSPQCTPGAGNGLVNAVAGFGDAASLGGSYWVREHILGGNENVDQCAGSYVGGAVGGLAADATLGLAAAGARAGYSVWFRYYPNAKGVGVGLSRSGKRVLSADWHKFKRYGRMMNRPHINGIPGHKHWPW